METLWQDLRLALRQLAVEKGFSAAALLTLTLGIGAAATLSVVGDAVLLAALPYRAPEELVILQGSSRDEGTGEAVTWPVSQMDFADWRARSTAFAELSVWGGLAFNLEQGDRSLRLAAELVNDSYFRLLGVEPAAGRFFLPEEDARPLEQFVVVLGHDLWQSSFGADPAVLTRKLQLNGRSYQVVGVAPRGFRGLSDKADLWVPSMLPPIPDYVTQRSFRWAAGVGRLAPGVSLRQAAVQLDGITAALARELPDTNAGLGATVTPLADLWFGGLRRGLLVLGVGAGILLLIACINVASLLLARSAARQRAWSIRVALGASRGRLVRQLLTESLLLALLGAAGGLLVAQWAAGALLAASGTELPSFVEVGAAPRVVAAILGLALLCGLGFGLAPIWTSFRSDLRRHLGRDDKRESPGSGWPRFQSVVVVAQVALALILSTDAVLMAQGFRRLIGQDLGFRPAGVLTFRTDLRGPRYMDAEVAVARLRQEYLPRIAAVPGVEKLAMAAPTMPTDGWIGGSITVEERASDRPDGTYTAILHAVSPEYFDVLGIPLRRGRAFTSQDTQSAAVVVSQALADQQWPGEDPLGKRLKTGPRSKADSPWLTVVGVAGDVRYEGLQGDRSPAPDVYLSLLQFVRRPLTVNFLVRPRPGVPAAELRQALHEEMRAIDPELPDYDMATLEERLARQTATARFQLLLIGLFTALALVLAAVGIYGVISYGVTQRSREIAIRMSLGADRRGILRSVVGRGAVLAGIGLGVGLAAVLVLNRLVAGLPGQLPVPAVEPGVDPLILAGTSLGLFLVTLAANYLPARRAAVLDPMAVLRLQ